MNSIIWFRSDLRVKDNIALASAMHESDNLFAVFIMTHQSWKEHGEGANKLYFMLENLAALQTSLEKYGIPLLIEQAKHFDDCPKVLSKLCETHKINSLYFNREYPFNERERDKKVISSLSNKIHIQDFDDKCVLAPGDVLNQQQQPFRVFTPFKRSWLKTAEETMAWHTVTMPRKKFTSKIKSSPIPDKITAIAKPKIDINKLYPAGEKAAHAILMKFCGGKIDSYKDHRDFPYLDGTSKISPYLSLGVLSPRQCIKAALDSIELASLYDLNDKKHAGVSTWISEVIWREFYHHISYLFPEVCKYQPFISKTDKLPWSHDQDIYTAWQNGQTGVPIVDAAMRQLLQTGWMHNRLRMVTAMYLTKICFIDWRMGEEHFINHLVDGDFAANNGGWQWCASTGTDAAPYFRIFNPITQSQKFDPEGVFLRQYCPELASLDNKTIHNPYHLGIEPNSLDYPEPIVDYKQGREKTIKIWGQI